MTRDTKVEFLTRILSMGVQPLEMVQMQGTSDNRKVVVKFCDGTSAKWRSINESKNSPKDSAIIAAIFDIMENFDHEAIAEMFEISDRGHTQTLLFSKEVIERAKAIHEQVMSQLN